VIARAAIPGLLVLPAAALAAQAPILESIVAGEYELTITPLSVERPGEGPDQDVQRAVGIGQPRRLRECYSGHPPRVGDRVGDTCTYTRIGDRDRVVDRAARCTGAEAGHSLDLTINGARAADRYDYRTRMTERDARGRIVVDVVVREEGRRLGPCPARAGTRPGAN
jgi:hypothetical protein